MKIYFDSIQEGNWFRDLHPRLKGATLHPFPGINQQPSKLKQILSYDRPDIILVDEDQPILALERTIEVPSGHNVGQRFARLVAAAEMRVPSVYFGPYAAYKHGGATQGPRYMNLRLFYAIEKLMEIENSAISLINWPVDQNYEIIQTAQKDTRIKEYLELFFSLYDRYGLQDEMLSRINTSNFRKKQDEERNKFIDSQVTKPEQYDSPPDSVEIGTYYSLKHHLPNKPNNLNCTEMVVYRIGMRNIRSDPYTGMAMLYSYLYCGGLKNRTRNLILHFPNITKTKWFAAASGRRERKDIRLYRKAADGILFADGYMAKAEL